MGRIFYFLRPFIVGIMSFIFCLYLNVYQSLSYANICGFSDILSSVVNFVSIVIGFYSAFYGMIISMNKTSFISTLKKSKYKNDLPIILLVSLISAFLTLLLTIILQGLMHYPSLTALIFYYVWAFVSGIFMAYALQTSILSIALVFGSEPEKIDKIKI